MDDTKVSNFHIAQVSEQYVELPELPSLPQYQSPPPTPTKDNDTRFGGGPYDMSLLSNSCQSIPMYDIDRAITYRVRLPSHWMPVIIRHDHVMTYVGSLDG
uniref:Uncharacterized protein n=1 Tax=Medicago truncatula TaxID=3880 RepID=Q2HV18_MEDTR|nr:hypothetical protein MtrDRAFT_AC149032g18v2 [Medicago truncatula]